MVHARIIHKPYIESNIGTTEWKGWVGGVHGRLPDQMHQASGPAATEVQHANLHSVQAQVGGKLIVLTRTCLVSRGYLSDSLPVSFVPSRTRL